jgi:hypothetical protein
VGRLNSQDVYRWRIVNGKKIKFREDNSLGNSRLAIHFWDIYVLVHEKTQTIFNLWYDSNLKCTFRRCVDGILMNL